MIEQTILQILSIAIPLVFLIDFGQFVEKFKRWKYYRRFSKDSPYKPYDLKPFDCSGCLSVWTYWVIYGVLPYLQGQTVEYIYLLVAGFACGLTAIGLRKYLLF